MTALTDSYLAGWAEWTARALDAVEAGTDPDRYVEYAVALNALPEDDAVGIAPLVLLPMLADAARALAEQAGQTPEEIVAEWRKLAALVLDGVAEGGGYE